MVLKFSNFNESHDPAFSSIMIKNLVSDDPKSMKTWNLIQQLVNALGHEKRDNDVSILKKELLKDTDDLKAAIAFLAKTGRSPVLDDILSKMQSHLKDSKHPSKSIVYATKSGMDANDLKEFLESHKNLKVTASVSGRNVTVTLKDDNFETIDGLVQGLPFEAVVN